MTMSKNGGVEKDDNDKDKEYQKGKIWSFHLSENWEEFWTYIAYIIVSDHLFSVSYGYGFDLTSPRIFSWVMAHLWFN